MRLPRVRFTVRGLMVAVAVVGVVLGGFVELMRRRIRFRNMAACLERRAMDIWASEHGDPENPSELVRWHFRMSCRYDYAAAYPWLPVETEPPPR